MAQRMLSFSKCLYSPILNVGGERGGGGGQRAGGTRAKRTFQLRPASRCALSTGSAPGPQSKGLRLRTHGDAQWSPWRTAFRRPRDRHRACPPGPSPQMVSLGLGAHFSAAPVWANSVWVTAPPALCTPPTLEQSDGTASPASPFRWRRRHLRRARTTCAKPTSYGIRSTELPPFWNAPSGALHHQSPICSPRPP